MHLFEVFPDDSTLLIPSIHITPVAIDYEQVQNNHTLQSLFKNVLVCCSMSFPLLFFFFFKDWPVPFSNGDIILQPMNDMLW